MGNDDGKSAALTC